MKEFNILVVDDSESLRNQLKVALEIFPNLNITEASTAYEALLKMQKAEEDLEPVNLVFLDINMPGISGVQLLEHLNKRQLIHEKPKFVIVSVESSQQNVMDAFDQGAIDFILKPYEYKRVQDIVKKLISN